jgi:glycosyltransferase involved in cell wall biosynthesis
VKARIVEYGVRPAKIVPIPAFSVQYLESGPGGLPRALRQFYERYPKVLFSYIRMRPLFYPVELVEGFARLADTDRGLGLVLCGASTDDHGEDSLLTRVNELLDRRGLRDRVFLVDDLDHEAFMEALGRASVYVRSHLSDGVCSSVLEAMSLGVPVVACENGTRPSGVITYAAQDSRQLAGILANTLERHAEIVSGLARPAVQDTVRVEADLLIEHAS